MYDPSSLTPGQIILVRSSGILADAIKFATVNPYSHAVMVGNGYILESLWKIVKSPLDKYATTGDAYLVDASQEQRLGAVKWMENHLGQIYGIEAILEDGARDIAHIPIWPKLNPRSVTCSGAVSIAYQMQGVILTYACLPSPADLSYSPLLVGKRPWEKKGAAI